MKAKYAIRALIHLASRNRATSVPVRDIAETEAIPYKFLEAILVDLRNEGIVLSKLGKGGGYALSQPADTINLARVVRLVEGPLAPVPCVSQTSYARCKDCVSPESCSIRFVMKQVRDAHARILEQVTLADMVRIEGEMVGDGATIDFQI